MSLAFRVGVVLCAVGGLSTFGRAQSSANWPQFRGTHAAGAAATAAPTAWDLKAGRNILWKTPIPGLSHSSPIVWGEQVFVLTVVPASARDRVGAVREPPLRLGDAGIDPADDMVPHEWKLYSLERRTGAVRWERTVHEGMPRMKRHVKASHASSTPATDGTHVVVLAGSQGLFCYDMSGKLLWTRDLGVMDVGLVDDPSYQWGPASSPIIYKNLVIVQNDRHRDSSLSAFDVRTGAPAWQVNRDELPSWATPLVFQSGSRTELVTNSGKYIRGYDPDTGRELWRLSDNATQVKVPSPVAAGSMVVVTGGYPPAGRPIYAIRAGATGEIAPNQLAWRTDRGSSYTSTPIVHNGILYSVTDNGILSAYQIATGERLYQTRMSEAASGFSASPVAAGDKLYFASEDGDVFVVQAGPQFKLVATNPMGEPCMATPAVVDGTVIVRTRTQIVAIGQRPQSSAKR
ncbi:MAG TPA: PQQ-binding-like beta-propeller repeat protein [Vicinamibacterales bacterium]|nr:PQQ-binding-like beta-propeller repeat protein [Vicinamibacterales bacterium]